MRSRLLASTRYIFEEPQVRDELGSAPSAFNLSFVTVKHGRTLSVECAYQGSKVFEQGGPYVDLYEASSSIAKRDDRLRSSGRLLGFRFFGADWGLEPQTAFYDWLYLNALAKSPQLHCTGAETTARSPTHRVQLESRSTASPFGRPVCRVPRIGADFALSSKDAYLSVECSGDCRVRHDDTGRSCKDAWDWIVRPRRSSLDS